MDDVAPDLWRRLPGYESDGSDDEDGAGVDAELGAAPWERLALVRDVLGERWEEKEYVDFDPVQQEASEKAAAAGGKGGPSGRGHGAPPRVSALTDSSQLLYRIKHIDAPIVLGTLTMNGFQETPGSNFTLQWSGPRMSDDMYRFLLSHQKVNHFPCSTELTRKDRMFVHLQSMAQKFGKHAFNFVPETYILPKQLTEFLQCYQRHPSYMWIVKPHASSRGRGIFVLQDVKELALEETSVVCRYVHDPLLIQGLKFDLRVYVIVTSFSPLRAYVYREGLTRFACAPYSNKPEHISDLYRHLTNYSINKYNPNFVENQEVGQDNVGHKWSFSALNRHLEHTGVNTSVMWSRINDLVVKTLLAVEPSISRKVRDLNMKHPSCFEVYGFDVLVDTKLKPWLLEVNLSPSMRADSPLDWQIKSSLLADAFNLVGVHRPDPEAMQRALAQSNRLADSFFARSSSLDSLRNRRTWAGPGNGGGYPYPLPMVVPSEPGPTIDTSAGWSKDPIALEELSEAQLQMLAQSLAEFGRRRNFLCLYPTRAAVQRYASITEAQATRLARESFEAMRCRLAPVQLLACALYGPRPIRRNPSPRGQRPMQQQLASTQPVTPSAAAQGRDEAGAAAGQDHRLSRPPPLPRSDASPSALGAPGGGPRPPPPLLAMAPPSGGGGVASLRKGKVALKPRLPPMAGQAAAAAAALTLGRAQSTPALLEGRARATSGGSPFGAPGVSFGASVGSRPSTAASGSACSSGSPRSLGGVAGGLGGGQGGGSPAEVFAQRGRHDTAASLVWHTPPGESSPASPPPPQPAPASQIPPIYVFTSAHSKEFRNIEF